jgi:hypothetical protein
MLRSAKDIFMLRRKSQLSNLDSWVRQDASLIPGKLQIRLEERHFTIVHGQDIGIVIRSIPDFGEIAVLHRWDLHFGSLEQREGTSGSRMLTLVPERRPKQSVCVQLTTYNNGNRRPVITRRDGATSLSYERSGRGVDEVNAVLETLSKGFYHKPLFAGTAIDLRRVIAEG